MIEAWLKDPLAVAVLAGIGTGAATFARRMAIPTEAVRRSPCWRRARHAFAGFFLAGAAGFGVAALLNDQLQPTRLIGLATLLGACFDLTTSEGLAWLAKTYLRLSKGDEPSKP